MPRGSKAQTDANHEAIEAAASRLFRERGLQAVTVAEVMKAAGLTHGGFYSHFASKDELAAEACAAAFEFAAEKWRRRIDAADTPAAARDSISEGYLKSAYCDPTVATCPTATLVTDVARAAGDHPIREAYLDGLKQQIDALTRLHSGDRDAACVQLATMMGALLLARATHGDPLSEEIVSAARKHLTKHRARKAGRK
jgi:TetR/AcrR family transcriptional regulator, transcriptional repressor for nem operon